MCVAFAPVARDRPVSPATFCSQVTKYPLPLCCVSVLQLFGFINKNIVDYNFHFLKSIIIFSMFVFCFRWVLATEKTQQNAPKKLQLREVMCGATEDYEIRTLCFAFDLLSPEIL